ncbi:hypothetical protein MSG28_008842 [Choristoneura fumiferana]|uniref:Uncharacterized protein n=1 Tax=Choristoneura fumiferana TaxID=7141 RepID=A0ACC0J8B4_CHOFU|nr:hypothetical protein MSG28_008842 [Choristoneura fumiferana]
MLRNVEKKILSCLKTAYKRFYVDIGSVVGVSDKIWTISLNEEAPATPLVLLHGMDPWGMVEKPANVYEKYQIPLWVRAVATAVSPLNPLWAVRVAGPAGKWLISKTRPDLSRKYLNYVSDADTVINGAGHHVYLDKPDLFNKFVLEACARGDANDRLASRSADERAGDAVERSATPERSAARDERSGDQADEPEGTPERPGTNTPAS